MIYGISSTIVTEHSQQSRICGACSCSPIYSNCSLFCTLQLSFDDIVKYAGVYGEGSSALANLQVSGEGHVT